MRNFVFLEKTCHSKVIFEYLGLCQFFFPFRSARSCTCICVSGDCSFCSRTTSDRNAYFSGDVASLLGQGIDEVMRHHPELMSDAMDAIVALLKRLCEIGSDEKYVCKGNSGHKRAATPDMPDDGEGFFAHC